MCKVSPEIVIISYMHRNYRIERLLLHGQETEQVIFKFEIARKVGSSGLVPGVVPQFETCGNRAKTRFSPPLTVIFFCLINACFVGLFSI